MVLEVKDIIVIFRKIKTILILISFKHYFSHPENSILNLRLPLLLGGIVIHGPKLQCFLKVKGDLSKVLIFEHVTLNA